MAASDSRPPARGAEGELFRDFNHELMYSVAHAVNARNAQTVEDACAFAWAQFLEHQPDRDRNWRGWLFRTAQRQAWLIEREWRHVPLRLTESSPASHTYEAPSPIDDIQIHDDVDEALSVVRELPPRLRHIAMLRASASSTRRSAS
jgi:DNA-directed RNA polymerase specialized sigma24 family protein